MTTTQTPAQHERDPDPHDRRSVVMLVAERHHQPMAAMPEHEVSRKLEGDTRLRPRAKRS
jgi:hypothetical protein